MAANNGDLTEHIANEIKEEFCRRVIPSDLMRYLQCLTTKDIEKVREEEEKHGSMHAADVLLQRLVQQPDWVSHLKRALLNPDVGLIDFGERIKQMCIHKKRIDKIKLNTSPSKRKRSMYILKAQLKRKRDVGDKEEQITIKIKEDMQCLPTEDTVNVPLGDKKLGSMHAYDILPQKLVRRSEGLCKPLLNATDFRESVKQNFCHSTSHQLIELYHRVLLALEAKHVTSITFADISKAFDRVWIRALLYKLSKYGIQGDLLCWLKSYLTNRTQRVVIKDALSCVGKLHAGVPQGSVLGPLLFLVFINDITDDILGLGRLFADDTSIQHTANDETTLKTMINTDLSHLKEWSSKWLVKCNPNKTDIMKLTTQKNKT